MVRRKEQASVRARRTHPAAVNPAPRAAALGCAIAELQCPRWLNTLTVEYSAQHFYSQQKTGEGMGEKKK